MVAPIKYAENTANIYLSTDKVKVEESFDYPAYVNVPKKTIKFRFTELFPDSTISTKQMMSFNGLLFHEILHIKHTVRARQFKKQVYGRLQWLMNALEDGRIETLGILRHPKMADYFTYAVNNMLLKEKGKMATDDESLASNYILCYGRMIYFPDKELVAQMRKMMVKRFGIDLIEKVENYVDAYAFESSSIKRFQLAKELYELLNKNQIYPDFRDQSKDNLLSGLDEKKQKSKESKSMEKLMKDAEKVKSELNKELKELMEQNLTKEEKESIKQMKDLLDQISTTQAKAEKTEQKWYEEQDKDKADELKAQTQDLRDQAQSDMQDLNNLKHDMSADDLDDADELRDMIDATEESNDLILQKHSKDLHDDIKTASRLSGSDFADDTFNPDNQMRLLSKKLEKGLKELSSSLTSGYVARQSKGRLDPRRLINRSNPTDLKVFNRFMPNRINQSKMLINMFVDGSSSMNSGNPSRWVLAKKSCWVINDALNKDENKIMVYQFSSKDEWMVMKEYDGKLINVDKNIAGNTHVYPAIYEAIPKIRDYQKANRFDNVVNIIITDGGFHEHHITNEAFKKLKKAGHHTILVGVGHTIQPTSHPDVEHIVNVPEFKDLSEKLIRIFKKMKIKLVKEVI